MVYLEWKVKKKTDYTKIITIIVDFLSPGSFLLISGKLGSGKTFFTKLVAQKLGVKKEVISPSFNILRSYALSNDIFLNHFDFFRLKEKENLNLFEQVTHDNINIIEWPEKNKKFWEKKKKKYFLKITEEEQQSENKKIRNLIFSDKSF